MESGVKRTTDGHNLVGRKDLRPTRVFDYNLAHRIALKASGVIEAAATDELEITEATVCPAELLAVTANSNFFPEAVAGTTRLWLSNPEIRVQLVGSGFAAETVVVVVHEYHLYEVEIGPVPVHVPAFAVTVLPTTTPVGLKLGVVETLGAIRIGPKLAENVDAEPVPALFVEVVAVTLATRYLPTQAWFSEIDVVVNAVDVHPVGMLFDATEIPLQ